MSKNTKTTTKLAQTTLFALSTACTIGTPKPAFGKKPAAAKEPETAAETPPEVKPPKRPKLKFTKEVILLSALSFSSKHQAREKIDAEVLSDYTEIAKAAKEKGADSPFPALKAVRRGEDTFIFSGFTRGGALKKAGYEETAVEVAVNDEITDSEIFRLAIEANAEQGARLTNADKAHNLARALKFPEYAELSNLALSDVVGCSEYFIRQHRPVSAAPKTRVNKKGQKFKATKTAKKDKPAKVSKAAKKAAANLAKNQGDLPGTEGATGTKAPESKLDEKSDKALSRICTVIDGKGGFKADEVRKAVESGTIKVSGPDLQAWATTSDSRLLQVAPLIVTLGWSPKKAFAHIDKEVESSTKLEHCINSAIATGGVLKRNSICPGEVIADNKTYTVIVFDNTKYDVKIVELKGGKKEAPAEDPDDIR